MSGTAGSPSWDTTPPAPAAGRASPLLSALFLVFAALVLLRVAANPLLLDLLINYTSDSGSIVEKIHPTLYGFAGIGLVATLCFRITLTAWETRVTRAMLLFIAGIVALLLFTAALGRGGSAGFLIDTYAATAFVTLFFLFPPSWRLRIGQALILWLVASAMLALAEFALKIRLQPFEETEYSFRPIGLASHPLDLGLWTATAIPFCAAAGFSRRVTVALTAILVAGLGASGARFAGIIGLSGAVLIAVAAVGAGLPSQKRLERRIIALTAALLAVPLFVGALYAAGALARFGAGLDDPNAQARVAVYGVFEYLSWSEIFFGADAAKVRAIALDRFRITSIESSVVTFVMLFGALGSAFFAGLFGRTLRTLLSRAKPATLLGALVFFVIVLSANGLSSKGSSVFLLFCLIVAFRPPDTPAAAPR